MNLDQQTMPTGDDRPEWARDFASVIEHAKSVPAEQREAERLERQAAADRESAEKNHARLLALYAKLSDIGVRFADRTFETFDCTVGDPKAFHAAATIAENPEDAGWFYGPPGFGKTHLAAAIVNAINALGRPGLYAVFTTALSMLDRLKASYSKSGTLREGEIDIIDRYSKAPVLVLDDLDKARFTEWTSERFYALINRRYERRLPMVVTTNLSPADLGNVWKKGGIDSVVGAAILDRLLDMSRPMIRVQAEHSYRGGDA